MRLKIYQIDLNKDQDGLCLKPLCLIKSVDPTKYRKVFDAEVEGSTLAEAEANLADNEHPLMNGLMVGVSDVMVTEEGAFYRDGEDYKKIDFDESKVETADQLRVLFVRAHEAPYEAWIPDTLEAKQHAVGGYIELVYITDETALVCDEEGKIKGKEGNRYIDSGGIVAGDFLVVGLQGEDFRSLTDDEVRQYMAKYAEAPDISPEETTSDVGFKFISL